MVCKIKKLYLVDGKEVDVHQLRKLIVDAVGKEKISSFEIAKRINAKYIDIKGAIASMVVYRFLQSSGTKTTTVYFVENPCLLQNILHPIPNFEGRILGTYKHTEDKQKHNDKRLTHTESFNASALYYFED